MARNNDYERSAAGLDFDGFSFRDRAQALGQAVAENGPGAIFEEVETMIPDHVRAPDPGQASLVTFDFWQQFDSLEQLEEFRRYRPSAYFALPEGPA